MTLALTGATVVTQLDPVRVAFADVLVEGGRIAAVGSAREGIPVRDCTGCLILPGNVCAHTHLYSSLARGMPYPQDLDPPESFVQTLQRVWWRLDRALDHDGVRASAMVGAMEALLAGTTTLVDHHASPNAIDGSLDAVADACEEIGVRSVLCYEVSDRDGADRAQAGVAENRRFLKATSRRRLARGMVGAHASFTLSEETLSACVDAARSSRVGIHIHVAEDRADLGDCEARFAKPVVDRLALAGVLTERALLAHCVHLHPAEIGLVQEAGATVVHNARSNMNNAVGRAPAEAFEDRVALGTDGIDGDMFAESRAAHWRAREDDVLSPPLSTLRRLAHGSSFVGQAFEEPALGRIERGAPADLVVLDYPAPGQIDASSLAGHWFFGLGSRHVRDVMVAGDLVVADRRLTRVDQDKVAADAAGEARRLRARLEDIEPHPFAPAGVGRR